MATSLVFMAPVLVAYFQTGLVERMPTWVFSLVLMVLSFLLFTAGLILDSVSRARAEQLRIHYMSLPSLVKRPAGCLPQQQRDAKRGGQVPDEA